MKQDEDNVCPICLSVCSIRFGHARLENRKPALAVIVECPRCGDYSVDSWFQDIGKDQQGFLGPKDSRIRANLSSFIRERHREDGPLPILARSFAEPHKPDLLRDEFLSLPPISFHQRADRLLQAIEAETVFAGDTVDFRESRLAWMARAWALNDQEFEEILTYLIGQTERLRDREDLTREVYTSGGAKGVDTTPRAIVQIRPEGWAHLEEINKQLNSTQGFVAMWFEPELDFLYEKAIFPAINNAGYSSFKIDLKPGDDRLDHRIEVEIKRSRFLVADMTGHRGGVYFEAGFARALGRPVFYTCHKDDFDELHFDTRQFNCLDWDCATLEKLAEDLRYHIENVCGRGPNPAH